MEGVGVKVARKSYGADAKEVALYFIKKKDWKPVSALIVKSIQQAKAMLKAGFTKEDIIKAIDYIIDVEGVDIYSLGYLNVSINDIMDKLKVLEVKNAKFEIREEVKNDGSTSNNQRKANRLGTKSRLRESYHFDMFER